MTASGYYYYCIVLYSEGAWSEKQNNVIIIDIVQ